MQIQAVYDLREVTGFVSGSELAEMFREYCGTPSPSGRDEMPFGFPRPEVAMRATNLYFKEMENLAWVVKSARNPSRVMAEIARCSDMLLIEAATRIRMAMES